MNNEKLLGKWEDLKFSYDFQKNNTVELYWKDKNITEKGIYSIEENILNLKYGKYYKGSWKGEIVSISKKKLELKDLTIDSRDYGKIETYIRVKEDLNIYVTCTKRVSLSEINSILDKRKINLNYIVEENGFNFSGGEKQRIILGRALQKDFKIQKQRIY
jgi:hypothetical protein